jgi:hypothetical protein
MRRQLTEQAIGVLSAAAVDAANTLKALLSAESDTARLGAARVILEAGPRLREIGEMESRLAELEQMLPSAAQSRKADEEV